MDIRFPNWKDRFRKSLRTRLCFLGSVLIIVVWNHSGFETSFALAENRIQSSASSLEFQQIALMPFLKGSFESPDGGIDKPLSRPVSQFAFEKQDLRDDADQIMTRLVAKALQTRFGERFVDVKRSMSVFKQIAADDTLDTPRKLAKAFGDKLQAEAIVVGSVWRYRDRGSVKDMPDIPTSVAFELFLMEAATARRLWRGKFNETQKALTDDVIRGVKQLKMGSRWLTADELARYGVKEVLKKFPIRD